MKYTKGPLIRVTVASVLAATFLAFTGTAPSARAEPRMIILGFDGVDPTIVEKMIGEGALPNLAALRESGGYSPLGSTIPPQSPTAWSSFATSKMPGNHGVYDFVRRTPKTYIPGVGFGRNVSPTLSSDGSLAKPPGFKNIRKGVSFWSVANNQGVKCKILSVPFAFPVEDLSDSLMIGGLGVPDIRGTTSKFVLMSDTIDEASDPGGGLKLPLVLENDSATVMIEGLRDVSSKLRRKPYLTVPLNLKVDRTAHQVEITVQGTTQTVREGAWSDWVEWAFEMTPNYTVSAISRFFALEVGEHVTIYMSCLQFHPSRPYMQLTTPPSYGAELEDRYGLFKTIGWIHDTHAVRLDALTEHVFLDDVQQTMAWREQLTLDEMDRGEFDLLVSAWTGTDRVAHLFWQYCDPDHALYTEEGAEEFGNAVEETYKQMDGTIGKVMAKLSDEDLLLVISDHGFHSFRKGFNVNTWLIRNGYLAVTDQDDPATAHNLIDWLELGVRLNPGSKGYDWSKSSAYSIGLGSVFLNLKGREGKGIVEPGDAESLIAEIRSKLLKVVDPETGTKVFNEVYTRDVYKGSASAEAPDIQLGYADGYQSSKDTVKGVAPKELFEINDDKWSGEHAASDRESSPGILFSNKPLGSSNPEIIDIGVTALSYLGKNVPSDFEGKNIF